MNLDLAVYIMSFGVLTHNTKRQSTEKSKGFPGLNKIKDFYCERQIKRQVKNLFQNILIPKWDPRGISMSSHFLLPFPSPSIWHH